MKSSIMSIPL